jgi:hypothetical protein
LLFCSYACRQQRLQFRPPFEEIKAKYFREMKKFIAIPNHFKGVSDGVETTIFPAIIIRNAEGFSACYRKAATLFKRLAAVLDKFSVRWLSLCQFKAVCFIGQSCFVFFLITAFHAFSTLRQL